MNKTYSAKPADTKREWHLIDASGLALGRLSAQAAQLLIGKGKTTFTPHVDGGDFVVVINAEKVKATGNKPLGKVYYRHSGYPGGIKSETLASKLQEKPAAVIERSVRGMLPVNKLRAARMARLKVYDGSEHPHAGQLSRNIQQEKGVEQ